MPAPSTADALSPDDLTPVAAAFGLGEVRAVRLVQHTSFPAWRLDTDTGRALVKRLWEGADPEWRREREAGMRFERRALEAGVRVSRPLSPLQPTFGVAARVEGLGVFRAHEWLDHRPVSPVEDLHGWLGDTLARLHRLEPLTSVRDPRWWGLEDSDTWRDWSVRARGAERPWATALAAQVAPLLEVSDRLRQVWREAGDWVTTHGDLEPSNVLITPTGPVLVDFDSVGPESASLEVGRAALAFGHADPPRMAAVLRTYLACGGRLVDLGDRLLLRSLGLDLGHLTERITAALGLVEAPGWLDLGTVDRDIATGLAGLPAREQELRTLARHVLALV